MTCIDYKKAYDIVLQSWTVDCLKLYNISDEDIKSIERTMKNWRVEPTAGGKSFAITICESGNATQCTGGYKLIKSQEKINFQIYMDNIKLCGIREKELELLIQAVKIYSQDIGMESGIMMI